MYLNDKDSTYETCSVCREDFFKKDIKVLNSKNYCEYHYKQITEKEENKNV